MGTFVEPTGRLALNGAPLKQMVPNAEVPSSLHHRLCQVADQSDSPFGFYTAVSEIAKRADTSS